MLLLVPLEAKNTIIITDLQHKQSKQNMPERKKKILITKHDFQANSKLTKLHRFVSYHSTTYAQAGSYISYANSELFNF